MGWRSSAVSGAEALMVLCTHPKGLPPCRPKIVLPCVPPRGLGRPWGLALWPVPGPSLLVGWQLPVQSCRAVSPSLSGSTSCCASAHGRFVESGKGAL